MNNAYNFDVSANGDFLDAMLTMPAINIHMLKYRKLYLETSWPTHRRIPMREIILHGWAGGFQPQQTALECMFLGYSFAVCIPEIKRLWRIEDARYNEFCNQGELPANR